jgi:hypothetical protein
MQERRITSSIWRIVGVFLLFAVPHSLLASQEAKRLAERRFGTVARNGLYRFTYNALSVAFVVPMAVWFSQLPDRTLYRVPKPWSYLWFGIQVSSLLMAVQAAQKVGLAEITGIGKVWRLLQAQPLDAEPEAQGPVRLTNTQMDIRGPFLISRHPLNLAPVGIFWLFPRMTVNRALLAALSTLYLMIGSAHEEKRLRASYGKAYQNYQDSRVSFFFPTSMPHRHP